MGTAIGGIDDLSRVTQAHGPVPSNGGDHDLSCGADGGAVVGAAVGGNSCPSVGRYPGCTSSRKLSAIRTDVISKKLQIASRRATSRRLCFWVAFWWWTSSRTAIAVEVSALSLGPTKFGTGQGAISSSRS